MASEASGSVPVDGLGLGLGLGLGGEAVARGGSSSRERYAAVAKPSRSSATQNHMLIRPCRSGSATGSVLRRGGSTVVGGGGSAGGFVAVRTGVTPAIM